MPISFPLTPTSPHLLPQATGSQLATVLRAMSSVIIGLTIGFYYSWALTLLILAFAPIIFMSGFIRMKLVQGSKKSNDAKALEEAGKVGANNYFCLHYLYLPLFTFMYKLFMPYALLLLLVFFGVFFPDLFG